MRGTNMFLAPAFSRFLKHRKKKKEGRKTRHKIVFSLAGTVLLIPTGRLMTPKTDSAC